MRAKQRDSGAERATGEQLPVSADADAARRSDASALAVRLAPVAQAPLDAAAAAKQNKKRRRDGRDRRSMPGAEQPYVPPPETPDLDLLFTMPPNLVRSRMAWAWTRRVG